MRCDGGDRKSWQVMGFPFWDELYCGLGRATLGILETLAMPESCFN